MNLASSLRSLGIALLVVLLVVPAQAADVTLNDNGMRVAVKGMADFNFSYPTLQPGNLKPLQKKVSGQQADLTYAQDIRLRVALADDGGLTLSFNNAKAVKSFTLGTQFGLQFADGGTWAVGDAKPQSLPAEKPPQPHLYKGSGGSFTLTDVSGHVLFAGGFPDFAYQEVMDLREWGTRSFSWKISVPFNPRQLSYTFVLSETPRGPGKVAAVPATKAKVLVDRFGQTTLKDFPGKVKDEADLKADVAGEAAYWATYKPLPTDSWGGQPGSGEKLGLKGSGFFRVEKKDDRWLLLDPDGNVTFHAGVCDFGYNPGDEATYIKDRREIFEWIPPLEGEFASAFHPDKFWRADAFSFYAANVIRKYGSGVTKDEQITRLIDRVRAVGFNAIGAFSAASPAFAEKHIPRMQHVGFSPALPGLRGIADPFDASARQKMEEQFAKSLPPAANDPLIIGYFFGNEQGFEDIPRSVAQLAGKYAAKRKLVEMLQGKYPTIADFNLAWGLEIADFAALADKALPVTTQAAFSDMQAYTELFLDAYFRFLTETFRKYDKNHLMVSNRWQPGTANNETLCRIGGKYMDVISINYYGWGVDRDLIERIYHWTGDKPQMWSEFFFSGAPESNAAAYNRDMATQKLRGQAYRQYVEHAAATGFVIGTEWFSLIDQAVTGRWFSKLNGERANNGLFNACDRPYDACLREMADAHRNIYDVLLGGKKAFELDDPRVRSGTSQAHKEVQAGRIAPGGMNIDGLGEGWPGRPPEILRSHKQDAGKDDTSLEATFKLAWDDTNLYLLINVTDPTPLNNSRQGAELWQGDGVELFIGSEKLDQPGGLLFTDHQVLLGAALDVRTGKAHLVNAAKQPEIGLANVAAVDGSGYTMEAAIPWNALHVKPGENTVLLFDIAVDDAPAGGPRKRQMVWNGGSQNSTDRSHWGRLRLVP